MHQDSSADAGQALEHTVVVDANLLTKTYDLERVPEDNEHGTQVNNSNFNNSSFLTRLEGDKDQVRKSTEMLNSSH